VSIPNLITLGRILLVPVVVWAITAGEMRVAFVLFLAAGISDAVDGFLAKRFGMTTELGAYLDPLADKAMLVSMYIALGIIEAIPRWLVIIVVSRDIMIVCAVILSLVVDKPVPLKPLMVSKLNTVAQIVLVAVASAHRHDALQACGFLIDYLKTDAPFWKKEQTPQGVRWVEARSGDEQARAAWERSGPRK